MDQLQEIMKPAYLEVIINGLEHPAVLTKSNRGNDELAIKVARDQIMVYPLEWRNNLGSLNVRGIKFDEFTNAPSLVCNFEEQTDLPSRYYLVYPANEQFRYYNSMFTK